MAAAGDILLRVEVHAHGFPEVAEHRADGLGGIKAGRYYFHANLKPGYIYISKMKHEL